MVVEEGASADEIELVYRESFARFVRVAQGITHSREAAVDAVQEAFASVLHTRLSYRRDGPLEAWIWRAVVNAALRSVRERTDPLVAREMERVDAGADGLLRAWISQLPERQRLTVFLRYYADLDYQAIALALDVRVGTVGATLNQAHATLRGQLAEVGVQ